MLNRRYVLLKELPTFKAGDEFFISEKGNLIAGTPEKPKKVLIGDGDFIVPVEVDLMAYAKETLEQFPNILTDWFEEIEVINEFFVVMPEGVIIKLESEGAIRDADRFKESGNYFKTKEEAEKHLEWLKARATLLRTVSKNGMFNVCHNSVKGFKVLETADVWSEMMFATEEDARQSIRNHEKEWKIYLGVE